MTRSKVQSSACSMQCAVHPTPSGSLTELLSFWASTTCNRCSGRLSECSERTLRDDRSSRAGGAEVQGCFSKGLLNLKGTPRTNIELLSQILHKRIVQVLPLFIGGPFHGQHLNKSPKQPRPPSALMGERTVGFSPRGPSLLVPRQLRGFKASMASVAS